MAVGFKNPIARKWAALACAALITADARGQDEPPAMERIEIPVFDVPGGDLSLPSTPALPTTGINKPDRRSAQSVTPTPIPDTIPDTTAADTPASEEPAFDFRTEAADRGLAYARDSYLVTITTSKSGRTHREYGREVQTSKWSFGPTTLSVRLKTSGSATGQASTGIKIALAEWRHAVPDWHKRTFRATDSKDVADELARVLTEARKLIEHAEAVLRPLEGLQHYSFVEDSWDPHPNQRPQTGEPFFDFAGALKTSTSTGVFNPDKVTKSQVLLPAWNSHRWDQTSQSKGRDIQLSVWQFEQSDIDHIRKLLADLEGLRERLTFRPDPDLVANESAKHYWLREQLHQQFRDPLIAGILEVTALAWWMRPSAPPDRIWATKTAPPDPVFSDNNWARSLPEYPKQYSLQEPPLLAQNAPRQIPPLPTNKIVALSMPTLGLSTYNTVQQVNMDSDDPPPFIRGFGNPDGYEEFVYGVRNPALNRHWLVDRENYHHSRDIVFMSITGQSVAGSMSISDDKLEKIAKPTFSLDEAHQQYEIDWLIEHEGDAQGKCYMGDPTCTPDIELYQPPPFLAMEGVILPNTPAPYDPAVMGFRIQNNSLYTAGSVSADLWIMDRNTQVAATDLTIDNKYCKPADRGDRIRCELGHLQPGALADLLFTGTTPEDGQFVWYANLSSKGDLIGTRHFVGLLGEPPKQNLLAAVVIGEQTGYWDYVPKTPYPAGPNGRGNFSRNIMLVGTNLPDNEETKVELKHGEKVRYFFVARDDTKDENYAEIIRNGWATYFDMENPEAATARAKKEGLSTLLITAHFDKDILPGEQTVVMNGASAHWDLQFSDIHARLSFVRSVADQPWDYLRNIYAAGRVYVALETSIPLPLEEIPVVLDLSKLGTSGPTEKEITLRRSKHTGKHVYLSKPLDLHWAQYRPALSGGIPLPVHHVDQNISVHIKPDFVASSFRLANNPVPAIARISASPEIDGKSWLWNSALARAAICHDKTKGLDFANMGAEESEEIWNLLILEASIESKSLKFGHHAAVILLRDMYLQLSQEGVEKLTALKKSETRINGLIKMLQDDVFDDTNPILRQRVPFIDGGHIEFRHAIINDAKWLAGQHGKTEQEILAYRTKATIAAVDLVIENAREAMKLAKNMSICDAQDLLKLTGFNFTPISKKLKAELVAQENARRTDGSSSKMWTADLSARFWVDQVAPLAAAVRRQEKRSEVDTQMTLMITGLVTLPLMAWEGGTALTLFLAGIDLIDFGVTTVSELSQYADSQNELAFAKGATILLGDARYKQAKKNAKGWISVAFGISTSGLGAVGGVAEVVPKVVPKVVTMQRIARGRRVAAALESPSDLGHLDNAAHQDFVALATSAHMRRAEKGLESLTYIERKALKMVERYRSGPPTRIELPPDLPPSRLAISHQPSKPMSLGVAENPRGPPSAFEVEMPIRQPHRSALPDESRVTPLGERPNIPNTRDPPAGLGTETPTQARPGQQGQTPGTHPDAPTKPIPDAPARRGPPSGIDSEAPSQPMSGRPVIVRSKDPGDARIDDIVWSDDIPNTTQARIVENTTVKVFDDDTGEVLEIPLGTRLGGGSTSEAFDLPSASGVEATRITFLEEGSAAVKLDEFGGGVLKNLKSENIRGIEVIKEYEIVPGQLRKPELDFFGELKPPVPAVKVAIVEQVIPADKMLFKRLETPGITESRILRDPQNELPTIGKLTQEEMDCFGAGMRDLNREGYVWLDNKPDNFAFVRNKKTGKLQLVILDTGSIIPVRSPIAKLLGLSDGDLARNIQLLVNGEFAKQFPKYADVKRPTVRTSYRLEEIKGKYGDALDLDKLDLNSIEELWFNPYSGELFSYFGPQFELPK